MSPEELRRRVEGVGWYHTMDLGDGIITPGANDTYAYMSRIGMPADLTGKTVLDIGAWDGAYSFEAERRGAARVLATDHFCWSGPGWGTRAGFDLAREALGSRVEDRDIDLAELSDKTVGTFDIVLFLGVLYHLQDPLSALRRLAPVTRELLILETVVDLLCVRRPAIAIYPGSELSNDATNWCGPNPAAVEALLRCAGFRSVRIIWPTGGQRLWQFAKAAGRRVLRGELLTHRMVFHAIK
jgi:tRNA (mo5U34)-methyltransferase